MGRLTVSNALQLYSSISGKEQSKNRARKNLTMCMVLRLPRRALFRLRRQCVCRHRGACGGRRPAGAEHFVGQTENADSQGSYFRLRIRNHKTDGSHANRPFCAKRRRNRSIQERVKAFKTDAYLSERSHFSCASARMRKATPQNSPRRG